MKLIDRREAKTVMEKDGVLARGLYDAPEAAVIHIEVAPGGEILPHVTPVDMEFFVLEGRGVFILGEQSREAGEGILILSPRGVPHGMKNTGNSPLRVLAIKNPRP